MQQRIWFDAPVSVKMNVRRLLNLVFPQEWHTAVAARHAGLLARWLCWLSNMNINAAVTSLPQAFIFLSCSGCFIVMTVQPIPGFYAEVSRPHI